MFHTNNLRMGLSFCFDNAIAVTNSITIDTNSGSDVIKR